VCRFVEVTDWGVFVLRDVEKEKTEIKDQVDKVLGSHDRRINITHLKNYESL
jgi:hypothetical protein